MKGARIRLETTMPSSFVIVLATICLSPAALADKSLADKSDDDLVPGLAGASPSAGLPHELKPATTQESAAQPVQRGSLFRLRAVRPDQETAGSLETKSKSDPFVPDPIAVIETSKGAIKIDQ